MTFPASMFVHTATVKTYQGETATGPSFAAQVADACLIEEDTRLVASASGEQVTSGATLYARRSSSALYMPGSEVTSSVLPGRTARVINAQVYDSGALGLPDHIQVSLT